MSLVFVDLVKNLKNAVDLYDKNIVKKVTKNKKAITKNIFLLLLV